MSPRGRPKHKRPGGSDPSQSLIGRAPRQLLCLVLLGGSAALHAYTISLAPAAPKTVYLQIGVGTFTGTYCGNNCTYVAPIVQVGTPGNNTTVNTVSVSVAANAVGNAVAQAMTTDSNQSNSFFDGFAFCNAPTQLYIGGFYRTAGAGAGSVSITATVPAALANAAGNTIPFSQISWTTGGNGDAGAEPFPAGTFTAGAGAQAVGTIAQNQWAESCWTFSYKNTVVPAAGTYTGRVTYTLTAP
jgi:hypothetical protein